MLKSGNLRAYREAKGFSQQDVADHLGVDKSLYTRFENGQREPTVKQLNELRLFLEVPIEALVTLPIENAVLYPDGVLDRLEAAIRTHGVTAGTPNDVRAHYKELKKALQPAIDARSEALDFPNLGMNLMDHVGETIKKVSLDMRGEELIFRTIRIQNAQLEALTGWHLSISGI